jgi:GTP-binding protein YchF
MGFNCGIVGLPNVGKSTIFNAVTKAGAQCANYPFCTIDPNVGRVAVPDERLSRIDGIFHAKKVIPTIIEFVDIAGLVKGASRGEGLGNQFLGHIRQVDAIVHVVRCFEDTGITHVEGSTDPARDVDIINTELVMSDFETVSRNVDRLARLLKIPDKKLQAQLDCAQRLKAHLEGLKPARFFELNGTPEEEEFINGLHLITRKPVLYAANISETDLPTLGENNPHVRALRELAKNDQARVVPISAKIEEELAQLEPADQTEMLRDFGLDEPGLNRLIRSGYDLLGLITYFTAGEKEVRAWTVKKASKAPQAAGVIHSDFERGFICAEVYAFADLLKHGSEAKVREAGLYRKEGKDYTVQDGDIMHFLFNV